MIHSNFPTKIMFLLTVWLMIKKNTHTKYDVPFIRGSFIESRYAKQEKTIVGRRFESFKGPSKTSDGRQSQPSHRRRSRFHDQTNGIQHVTPDAAGGRRRRRRFGPRHPDAAEPKFQPVPSQRRRLHGRSGRLPVSAAHRAIQEENRCNDRFFFFFPFPSRSYVMCVDGAANAMPCPEGTAYTGTRGCDHLEAVPGCQPKPKPRPVDETGQGSAKKSAKKSVKKSKKSAKKNNKKTNVKQATQTAEPNTVGYRPARPYELPPLRVHQTPNSRYQNRRFDYDYELGQVRSNSVDPL